MDALTREARLLTYTDAACRLPFSYETGHDCAQGFVGGWVHQETGHDVSAPWRGRYRTALGCLKVVRRGGGLVTIMSRGLEAVGLARTEQPRVGDVGAVAMVTDHGEQPVGAILGPDGWLSLTGRGIRSSVAAEFVAAWRLP